MVGVTKGFSPGPLFWVLCSVVTLWAICTFILIPEQIILIENAILIAAGSGVTAAYFPPAFYALCERRPSRIDILSLGIWLAWFSIPGERMLSFFGRLTHKNIHFYNTNLHTGLLSLTILAGLCHLLAPEAIAGRIPPKAWMRLGGIVFIAVLAIAITVLMTGFGPLH